MCSVSDKETWTGDDEDLEPEVRRKKKKKIRVPGVCTFTVALLTEFKMSYLPFKARQSVLDYTVFFVSVWWRVTLDLKLSGG